MSLVIKILKYLSLTRCLSTNTICYFLWNCVLYRESSSKQVWHIYGMNEAEVMTLNNSRDVEIQCRLI